jgi:hypothetical protein
MDETKQTTATINFEDKSKISVVVEGEQAHEVYQRTLSILEGKGITPCKTCERLAGLSTRFPRIHPAPK